MDGKPFCRMFIIRQQLFRKISRLIITNSITGGAYYEL